MSPTSANRPDERNEKLKSEVELLFDGERPIVKNYGTLPGRKIVRAHGGESPARVEY